MNEAEAGKKLIRAALYARVSTEEQKENHSIAAQLELLRKHSSQNEYEIAEEYVDGGFSGTSMERPAFQKLLRDAALGKFQLILVYRVDRFFRNNKALLTVTDDLEKLGVSIRSITEPFDTSTYLGRFTLSLHGSLAQLERDTFLERSRIGRLRRAKEGHYWGSLAKFGYDYDSEAGNLVINEKETKVVVLIFRLYNETDSSLVKVTRRLRKLGLRTKEGKEFQGCTVHDILRDGAYTGKWYANRFEEKDKVRKLRPRDQWIEVSVPRIIPDELFERTQRLLRERRNYSERNAKHSYLLQGMAKCGDCGSSVSGTADKSFQVKNGKKYGPYSRIFYRCTHWVKNRYEKILSCRLRYARAETLEQVVWNKVEGILQNPELIEKSVQRREALSDARKVEAQQELVRIDAKQQGLIRQEQRILEAYRQSIISIEQLKEQIEGIRKEKPQLETARQEFQEALQQPDSRKEVMNAIESVKRLKEGLGNFTLEVKRKVLHSFRTQVTLNVNGVVDILCFLPKTPPENPSIAGSKSNFFPQFPLLADIFWSSAVRMWD